MPDKDGNQIHDPRYACLMLCQLSYEAKSVRVIDISKLSPVPLISINVIFNVI